MALITEVEKAEKEIKLLINCGGYAGSEATLRKSPVSELV